MGQDFLAPLPVTKEAQTKDPRTATQDQPTQKTAVPPLSYREPEWAAPPTQPYFFEIIKEGVLLGKSGIIEDSKVVAGRLPVCDIEIEHPSASRYHAVIQFKENSTSIGLTQAVFIYDLASAHGTFVNKSQIEPHKYIRLAIGDTIRFGASSRLYLFQGPQDEVIRREEARMQIDARKKQEKAEVLEVGFKEDAYEGDEYGSGTDSRWGGVNVKQAVDRSLIPHDAPYVADPKKALSLFMENNGAESQISYTEVPNPGGPPQVTAKLEITGLQGPLAASGTGKRKGQAEKDACLEACYKLELLGILYDQRGSASDRLKRMRQDIEEDEEDNYLDKTAAGKKSRLDEEPRAVETHETLCRKRDETVARVAEMQAELDAIGGTGGGAEDDDEFEAYMNQINKKVAEDERSKIAQRIQEHNKELAELEKMIKLVAPSGVSAIAPKVKLTVASKANSPAAPEPQAPSSSARPPKTIPNDDLEFQPAQRASPSQPAAAAAPSLAKKRQAQGPSREGMEKHTVEKDEDFIDFIPPTEQSSTEEIKKMHSAYGF
ncbi:Kanadaptin [Kappamyces sp. JEL0829]|nr:Kanadaptin [Kappamyces sp. JEL0829]